MEKAGMVCHMKIEQLPYVKPVRSWLKDRCGEPAANKIAKDSGIILSKEKEARMNNIGITDNLNRSKIRKLLLIAAV